MTNADIRKKMFDIESKDVYREYIINSEFIIVVIKGKEDGEIKSYYVIDLVESKED